MSRVVVLASCSFLIDDEEDYITCDSNFLWLCSMAQTEMMIRPPILSTLANSLRAQILLSVVARWWTTAIDKTASRLSSLNGKHKLSNIIISLSFSLANSHSLFDLSPPMLNTEEFMLRYLPFPQPKIIEKSINRTQWN